MIAKKILLKADEIDDVSGEVQQTYSIEWTTTSEFAYEVNQLSEENKEEFADFLDDNLELIASMELDRERGIYGMYILDDSQTITFNVRRLKR